MLRKQVDLLEAPEQIKSLQTFTSDQEHDSYLETTDFHFENCATSEDEDCFDVNSLKSFITDWTI
ncbi:unnamed protein product, partial [Allacma fusca]